MKRSDLPSSPAASPPLKVRKQDFRFAEGTDRYWFGGSVFFTQLMNGFTLLFPDIERFVIKSMKPSIKNLDDEALKTTLAAFIGQETQHYLQHQKYWDNLRAQGYRIDPYLRVIRYILFECLERRLSQPMKLALIAGIEHYTLLLAEFGLGEDFLAGADPELRALFEWHAAEEIEHKHVAYDLARRHSQSYVRRVFALAMAWLVVYGMIAAGTFVLLHQDRAIWKKIVWAELLAFWFTKYRFFSRTISHSLRYLHPRFHPSQVDTSHLAERVLRRYGEEEAHVLVRNAVPGPIP